MEDEVLRILKLSPPWVPAMQNDKIVKAFHKQTITFIVNEEKDTKISVSSLPKLTVKQLQVMPFSRLVQPDTNYDQVSGAFWMDVDGGDIGETWFKTDKSTNEQIRKLIAKAQPGNLITIDSRMGMTKSGNWIKLSSLAYLIE